MPHKHPIYDTDPHFKIDGDTRVITNVSDVKVALMQGDHNSERFTFEIPRYVDGHDMSLCNICQIHYLNVGSSNRATNTGIYEVEDLQFDPKDEQNRVVLSWLISSNVTMYVGSLSFVIRFGCSTDEVVDYIWNTAVHSGITISSSICNSETVVQDYTDILEQWRNELFSSIPIVKTIQNPDGVTITITDKEGTTESVIKNGERGPQGEQGIQGLKGDTGPQGPKGDAGDPGKDAIIDKTLTKSGQAADAKVTGDSVTALKEDLDNLESSIKTIKWFDDYILQYGNINPSNGRSVSDYIMVRENASIEYIAETTNQYVHSIYFYDRYKTPISGFINNGTDNDTPVTVTSPKNAKYAKISIITSQKDKVYLHCDDVIKDRLENPINKNVKIMDTELEIDVTNYALLVDFYEGTDWMNGKFRNNSQSAGNTSTTIIKLDKTKDTYSTNTYTGAMVFFDFDKNYISQENLYYGKPVLKENYPENAEYVCFWFAHSAFSSDKWATTTRNNNTFPLTEYSSVIKVKGTRPRIDIYLSDSETEIYKKLCNAVYTQDCDVYFESGEYRFDSVYEYIKQSYNGAGDAFDMLLGGNCRYYMYNCKFYAKYTGTELNQDGYSLFGCHRHSDSFEVFGGTWIAEGCVYVVHDEASGEKAEYHRIFHDVTMQYISNKESSWISKCVGGGMGLHGHCVFDGCTFKTNNIYNGVPVVALSYHGCKTASEENPCDFKLSLKNCYYETSIALEGVRGESDYQYNYPIVLCCGNSFETSPSIDSTWESRTFNNEVRS